MKPMSSSSFIVLAWLMMALGRGVAAQPVADSSHATSPPGETLQPPIISVEPTTLVGALFSGGSSTHTLTITNAGHGELLWVSEVVQPGGAQERIFVLTPPTTRGGFIENGVKFETPIARSASISATLSDLRGVDILWDRKHGGSPLTSWSVIQRDLTIRGATVTENYQTLTPALLSVYDVLWLTDTLSRFSSAEIATVHGWVRGGGSLLIECDGSWEAIYYLLSNLGSGIHPYPYAAKAGITTRIHAHEATRGIASLYLPAPNQQLLLSWPARVLMEDMAGVPVCAISQVGYGRVFALTDEAFADGIISHADNQLFANQAVDALVEAVSWLDIAPSGGILPAGASQEASVTFDASYIGDGAHAAEIVIRHNDPSQSEIRVQSYLTITRAPDVGVSEDILDIGPVIIGVSKLDTVTVFNEGPDTLRVSDISSSHPDFAASPSNFFISPAARRDVTVNFVPASSGPITGSLTIASNDPDEAAFIVELKGEGLEPPIIAVSPHSFSEHLETGETSSQVLTISNLGASDLAFELRRSLLVPGTKERTKRLPDERVRIITPGLPGVGSQDRSGLLYASAELTKRTDRITGTTSQIMSLKSQVGGMTSTAGLRILLLHTYYVDEIVSELLTFPEISVLDVFDAYVASPAIEMLYNYDAVILIAGYPWDDPERLGDVLADYVDLGGGVIMTLASFIPPWDVRGRFARGGYYPFTLGEGPVGSGTLSDYDSDHPIMQDVTTVTGHVLAATTLAPAAVWVADWSIGQPFIAAQRNRVVAINAFLGDYGYWQGDIPLVLRNAASWLSHTTPWLLFEPEEGVVPIGGALNVVVRFNAVGVKADDYGASIGINSNDPATPVVRVPTHLQVTGIPDVAVSDLIMDFGSVFVGGFGARAITVTNAGMNELNVSGVSTNLPEFAAVSAPFSLEPFESRDIAVRFTPSSLGPLIGALTIESNDPDEATLEVELRGTGIEPPIISVAPSSIADSLFTGQTSAAVLTISNTGGNDLAWAASKIFSKIQGRADRKEFALTAPQVEATYREGVVVERPTFVRTRPITAKLSALGTVAILWDVHHGGSPSAGWSTIVSDLIARGATVTENHEFITPELLQEYDLLWLTDPIHEYYLASEYTAIQAWVRAGGSLLFECDESSSPLIGLLVGLDTGIFYNGNAAAPGITTNIHPHEATELVRSVYLGGPQDRLVPKAPAQILVEDLDGIVVCAASRAGRGRILAVTDELFADGPIASADNQLLANQAVDWLVGASDWVSIAPIAGTVPPGLSQDVTITLDAAGLYDGDYGADIIFENNDPLRSMVTIPASLHVTGASQIVVSSALVEFGSVYIGTASLDTIVVSNSGTVPLVVSDISSSYPDFSASPASFSLPPFENLDIELRFAPSSSGSLAGTLTIASNDPDDPARTVELRGEGVAPPVITTAPASLSAILWSGASVTQPLTISNQGGTDLIWSISTVFQRGPSGTRAREYRLTAPTGAGGYTENGAAVFTPIARTSPISAMLGDLHDVHVLWDRSHGGSPIADWSTMVADLRNRGATLTESSEPLTPAMLGGFEVLWLTDRLSTPFSGPEITAVQEWVRAGGSLLIECDESSAGITGLLAGLGSDIAILDQTGRAGATPMIRLHDTTRNVKSIYLPGPRARLFVTGTARVLVEGLDLVPICALSEVGGGKIVLLTDELFADGCISNADNQLFGNQIVDWAVGAVHWLELVPMSGAVPAGDAQEVAVTFDALGMYGGDYDARVEISNNDPFAPILTVPAHLHVSNAADISISDSTLDFGSPFVGTPATCWFTVTNLGTQVLEVRISSPHPDITADPFSFTVPVFGSEIVNVILVSTTPGEFTSSLVLSTNDPDESEVSLQLAGNPLPGPEVVVSPVSFHEHLFSGDQVSRVLRVVNLGGSPLDFAIHQVAAVDWLSLNPVSGRVAPAEEMEVTVSFDASGKPTGTYSTVLSIVTNAPAVPSIDVPAEIVVTGIPAMAVSDTLLDFGNTFVGYGRILYLTVSNVGAEALVVSEASVSDPSFSVLPSSFNLLPAFSQILEVEFLGAETGEFAETLSIQSNDPRRSVFQIPLIGRVLLPPFASVSADSIISAVEVGASTLDSLYLTNTGGSPLDWTAEVTYSHGAMRRETSRFDTTDPAPPLRVLWHGDHGWGDIAYWSALISYLASHNAVVTQSSAFIDAGLLAQHDVIWLGDRGIPFAAGEKNALSAWTSGGGRVLIEGDGSATAAVYNNLLEGMGSSLRYSSSPARSGATASIRPHETTYEIETIHLVSARNILYVFSPGVALVDDLLGAGRTAIACETLGRGRVIVMADHTFHDLGIHYGDNFQFAIQVFEWFGLPRWLWVAPASGSLAPGESALIEVTIDAAMLALGEHRLDVVLRSNDPVVPAVVVPALARVVEVGTGIGPNAKPTRFELLANYPNPFNPTTTIAYDLPAETDVHLAIYDATGRKIRDLVRASELPGRHFVTWDGRNASNEPVATGVYFYRLTAGDKSLTKKMVLLK